MKKNMLVRQMKANSLFLTALFVTLSLFTACKKEVKHVDCSTTDPVQKAIIANQIPAAQNDPITQVLTIAQIRPSAITGMTDVMFLENAEIFQVADGSVINGLRAAFSKHTKVEVTFNPWQASISAIATPSQATLDKLSGAGGKVSTGGISRSIDLAAVSNESIDEAARMGIINTTPASGLTNVIPDLATAQSMFNYLTTQCCALGGPFTLDYCISFQYCQDGCYARAQKMCYVLNNKYHYDTHKIFSFANDGGSSLSVKADKWGGCCVNWWYHVAPLVNVRTPSGVKAYVFDPAMFDQPVLLSTWLHFQENPACSGSAHVSMINIQPTESYCPASYSGLTFGTDPTFSSTNSTLVSYSGLITCP
jgi:hypothetical protein